LFERPINWVIFENQIQTGKNMGSMTQIPELQALMAAVERRFGEALKATTGFERLSAAMEIEMGEGLGSSTLKRIWGYIPGGTTPRLSTLDLLAKYAGYADFKSFRETLAAEDGSDYVTERTCVTSDELSPGDCIGLGWAPDRQVRLTYLGDDRFKVVESVNSKLRSGDVFEASCFFKGWPLYVPGILRDGAVTPPYIAGKAHGLTILERI
jgi:hypothetical protein